MSHSFEVDCNSNYAIPEELKKKGKLKIILRGSQKKLQWNGNMSSSDKVVLNNFAKKQGCQDIVNNLIGCCGPDKTKPRTKHLEFIFYRRNHEEHRLNSALIEKFEFIHSDNQNKPNNEWAVWKDKLSENGEMPVFYLGNPDAPKSMGLALMYRLPYVHNIKDAVQHTSTDHFSDIPDLASCIFGYVNKMDSLKGRVAISHAVASNAISESTPRNAVFGSPKPTYYPSYLEQKVDENGAVTEYKTLMDTDCEVRGWKRYPVKKNLTSLNLQGNAQKNTKVMTWFTPLQKGAQFSFKIRFHNLMQEELGALLWALTWGGDEKLCHSLGMGKAHGFGQVKVMVKSLKYYHQRNNAEILDQNALITKFEALMKSEISDDWKETPQLVQLLGMANPELEPYGSTQGEKLRHMKISGRNEFVKAKGNRRRGEPQLRLEPHCEYTGISDVERCEEWKKLMSRRKIEAELASATIMDKFQELCVNGNQDKMLDFFKDLSEDSLPEVAKFDFTKRSDILNMGFADGLLALNVNDRCKSLLCYLLAKNVKPNKQWSESKKTKLVNLQAYASHWNEEFSENV